MAKPFPLKRMPLQRAPLRSRQVVNWLAILALLSIGVV